VQQHTDAAVAAVRRVLARSTPRRVALVGASALIMGVILAGGVTWLATRPPATRVMRTTITPTAAAALTINGIDRDLAITPDGSRIVYVGANRTQLFVRALDALEAVAIFKGTPRGPSISSDGQWVGFFDGNTSLKKVAMTGGPAVTLASLDANPRGATWAPDGTMIFATNNATTGLLRASAAGGTPEVLTRPDRAQGEADHFWPEILPGGRAVLFTTTALTGGRDAAQVAVLDLQTGRRDVLVRGGSHAQYVSSGHLVYAAAGTLRAIAFDLARLETRGTPVPIIGQVVTTGPGALDAVVAGDGTLAYVSAPRGVVGAQRTLTLVWVSRQGQETSIAAPPRAYVYPRIAPDGAGVTLWTADQENDIWRWDFARTALTRLTFEGAVDTHPAWTPDGRRLVFSSERAGARNLFWQAADGTGAVERLTESPNQQNAVAVSPDGTRLIFTETAPKTGADVMQVELDGTHRVTPLVQTPFNEQNGIVSPDGRWLAYEANDSGRFEVCVRPVSGRERRPLAGVDGRRHAPALGRGTGRNCSMPRRQVRSCVLAWSAARRGRPPHPQC
jgi:serine/threonine-protein kinase